MVGSRWIACGLLLLSGASQTALAGGLFHDSQGRRKGSQEYYEAHAAEPTGSRQVYKYGKLWPPYPRPVGDHQPFWQKFHSTHYWPLPYVCADRETVHTFLDTQVQNGWTSATTLYEYHFDPQTNDLNSSGRAQLAWILTHVPEQYREVYVSIASTPEISSSRMSSVEKTLASYAGAGQHVAVVPRLADPVGRPAAEVQFIFKSALENQLPPKIEYQSANQDDASTGG
ncbi:hypothetical protein [Planctomicrobium sp. SH664]|uniref:hypothetical protein n=1 Tax=Planctomicrobium sp. SH664 TaxID=3448125 RepID=UPI003F5BFDD7